MKNRYPTSIRFSEQELAKLEEAMVLKGHRHLSEYIREKLFGAAEGAKESVESNQWAWREEMSVRLADMEAGQQQTQALLSLLLHLLCKRMGTGELSEVKTELEYAKQLRLRPENLLAKLEPQLDALLKSLTDDRHAAA